MAYSVAINYDNYSLDKEKNKYTHKTTGGMMKFFPDYLAIVIAEVEEVISCNVDVLAT